MKSRLQVLLLAVLALLMAGCQSEAPVDSEAETDTEEMAAIPVEAETLALGTISAYYASTGTLEADREAQIVPRLAGQIVSIEVEEGDRVQSGQVLARVDADRLRIEKQQAEADLSRMRQDYERHQEMHERSLISTEVFERVKYNFEVQQARVELVELELSYSAIRAPFAGVVSERMIKLGNQVTTVEPIFVITAMDTLQATLDVPERELARLQDDQRVSVHLDALPGQSVDGFVQRISPVVDADSGTFRVTVEVNDTTGRLRPGMFGRFQIVYDERESVLLAPVEAVAIEDGMASVFVVEEDLVSQRSIEIGYRNNGKYEVVSGLSEGEQVVVLGQAALRDGVRVTVLSDPMSHSEDVDIARETDLTDDEDGAGTQS
ncbi:MAG: efflux RND transporter periplasmic adaptor subunit [Pseudomonadota bacterium]